MFGLKHMKLTSPYTPSQIRDILYEQVDEPPSLLKCLLSFNAHFYKGTSRVCGKIGDSEFDLRNRKGPYASLRAKGTLTKSKTGTDIELNFLKPMFPNISALLLNSYKYDRQVILDFLKEWLKINEIAEPQL